MTKIPNFKKCIHHYKRYKNKSCKYFFTCIPGCPFYSLPTYVSPVVTVQFELPFGCDELLSYPYLSHVCFVTSKIL